MRWTKGMAVFSLGLVLGTILLLYSFHRITKVSLDLEAHLLDLRESKTVFIAECVKWVAEHGDLGKLGKGKEIVLKCPSLLPEDVRKKFSEENFKGNVETDVYRQKLVSAYQFFSTVLYVVYGFFILSFFALAGTTLSGAIKQKELT